MDERDRLISWLNDAYAMKVELLPILRDHADDAGGFPELRARIEQHIAETERAPNTAPGSGGQIRLRGQFDPIAGTTSGDYSGRVCMR